MVETPPIKPSHESLDMTDPLADIREANFPGQGSVAKNPHHIYSFVDFATLKTLTYICKGSSSIDCFYVKTQKITNVQMITSLVYLVTSQSRKKTTVYLMSFSFLSI